MNHKAIAAHAATRPSPARAFNAHKESLTGQIVGLKYRIDDEIGRGGIAVVYKGIDIGTKKPVAIKIIAPNDKIQLADALREANYLRQFDHPNILKCFDIGVHKIDDREVYYIVTELLNGQTLEKRLEQLKPFGWQEIRDGMKEIAQALQHMHDHGIVHRDIKPDNIFVAEGVWGKVFKIIDVGIARRVEEEQNKPGTISGTPQYIAPEAISTNATPSSDQYAFGAVLYELLTGQVAIEGGTTHEILAKQLHIKPEPVRKLRPEIPKSVEKIIARCLEKKPSDRFESMAHVADAIDDTRRRSYSKRELRKMENAPAKPLDPRILVVAITLAAIVGFILSLVDRNMINNSHAEAIETKLPTQR